MSRSNPTDQTPNPAVRWFKWDGQNGNLEYWDREAIDPKAKDDKKGLNIAVKAGFAFMLLDETSCIKGWNDGAKAGVWSNEVRDTRNEPMTVRLFDEKRSTIAQGLYAEIKDRVKGAGGRFTSSLYVAWKPAKGLLEIAGIQLKGAALSEWMEFKRKNRKAMWESAITITGFEEDKKGAITYRVPTFAIKAVKPETDAQAKELDKQLQEYLTGYFARQAKFYQGQPQHQVQPGEAPQADGNYDAGQEDGPPDPVEDPEVPPQDDDSPF